MSCPSHRMLAMRRGEKEDFLILDIIIDDEQAHEQIKKQFIKSRNECAEQITLAIEDGYKRLLQPSIEAEMRLFTKQEQEQIVKAANGGTFQNLLRFYGKFAPTGVVSGAVAGAGSYANPYIGIPLAAGAGAARTGAEAMRRSAIENLAAQMRLGRMPELQPRTYNVPVTGLRGLLSGEFQTEPQ